MSDRSFGPRAADGAGIGAPESGIPPTWVPVTTAAQLRTDHLAATTIAGQAYVAWTTGDQPVVWADRCPHRGARLSLGSVTATGCLRCPYHGWQFQASGACTTIPAAPNDAIPAGARVTRSLPTLVRAGLVWANPTPDCSPPPMTTMFDDPAFGTVVSQRLVVSAPAPRLIENFLDVTHLAIVHDGSIGSARHPVAPPLRIVAGDHGFSVRDVVSRAPSGSGSTELDVVRFDYELLEPYVVSVRTRRGDEEHESLRLMLAVTPSGPTTCLAYFVLAVRGLFEERALEDAMAFELAVFEEDRPIVESQQPELFSLDKSADLHLRSDSPVRAYRQHLRRSGATYGTDAGPPLG